MYGPRISKAIRRGPVAVAIQVAVTCLACSFSRTVLAQSGAQLGLAPRFDVYGNARSILADRPPTGVLRPSARSVARSPFQHARRSSRRGGGFVPFALSGDLLLRRPGRAVGTVPKVALPGAAGHGLSREAQRSYIRYGGFRPRARTADLGGALTAFSRRYRLVQATSLNAPIHRATLERPLVVGMRSSIDRTPFLFTEKSSEFFEPSTLDERLVDEVHLLHDRARAEGWAWFAEGQYRRAARSFETAWHLDPQDHESRIGELFCYVSIANVRTAMALLGQLNRRDINPFVHQIILANRYREREEAGRVGIEMQLLAEGSASGGDVSALGSLVLWYLGHREEALSAAVAGMKSSPGGPYSDWPAKIGAALAAGKITSERP